MLRKLHAHLKAYMYVPQKYRACIKYPSVLLCSQETQVEYEYTNADITN